MNARRMHTRTQRTSLLVVVVVPTRTIPLPAQVVAHLDIVSVSAVCYPATAILKLLRLQLNPSSLHAM